MVPKQGLNADELKAALSKPPAIDLTSYSFSDFYNQEFSTPPYIIDNLVIEGGINMIMGPSFVGKTFIALEYVLKVAQGGMVFGKFPTRLSSILIINEEDTPRSLHKRFHSMNNVSDLSIHLLLQKGIKINDKETWPLVVNKIKELQVGLVVFDNLAQLFIGEENSSSVMSEVFSALRQITSLNITVVLIHHQRKDSKDRGSHNSGLDMARGSSVIGASMDTILSIRKHEDSTGKFLIVTQDKNKFDEEVKSFRVNIIKRDESLSFVYKGEVDDTATTMITTQDEVLRFFQNNMGRKWLRKEIDEALPHIKSDNIRKSLSDLYKRNIIESKTCGLLSHEFPKERANTRAYWIPYEEESHTLFDTDYDNE